ncbi:MAG TPA: nuclear transport factor 2 family protein [Cyclobacteriaceae bacterium]|nr:nuclear transport factor 2 family protein [Cyclobacteriaceae bacterium]
MKKVSMLVLAVIFAACNPGPKAPSFDEAVTKKVLDHHLQTFQQNDLEGVMADYTEESFLITPDRTYKGLAEIRENFVGAFQALPAAGTTMTVTQSVVNKGVAYIVWKAVTPTLEFKYATDTFVILDGKIVSQTYAGDVVPVAAATPAE